MMAHLVTKPHAEGRISAGYPGESSLLTLLETGAAR